MIRGASISKKMNEEFWADAGREILRCYLFAADLLGQGSEAVQRWVHDPDDPQPVTILRETQPGPGPRGLASLLKQRLATNPPHARRLLRHRGLLPWSTSAIPAAPARPADRPGSHVSDDMPASSHTAARSTSSGTSPSAEWPR